MPAIPAALGRIQRESRHRDGRLHGLTVTPPSRTSHRPSVQVTSQARTRSHRIDTSFVPQRGLVCLGGADLRGCRSGAPRARPRQSSVSGAATPTCRRQRERTSCSGTLDHASVATIPTPFGSSHLDDLGGRTLDLREPGGVACPVPFWELGPDAPRRFGIHSSSSDIAMTVSSPSRDRHAALDDAARRGGLHALRDERGDGLVAGAQRDRFERRVEDGAASVDRPVGDRAHSRGDSRSAISSYPT
jgi:hypothetical protein